MSKATNMQRIVISLAVLGSGLPGLKLMNRGHNIEHTEGRGKE